MRLRFWRAVFTFSTCMRPLLRTQATRSAKNTPAANSPPVYTYKKDVEGTVRQRTPQSLPRASQSTPVVRDRYLDLTKLSFSRSKSSCWVHT